MGGPTITEFLLARLTEDEAEARKGGQHNDVGVFARDNYGCLLVQPARVLAECAAKRGIAGMHHRDADVQHMTYGDIYPCTECGDADDSPMAFPCPTIKALAAVYADHPDYQDAWAL